MKKKKVKRILLYLFLILVTVFMIYPIVWLFFGSFKSNAEIFGTADLLPTNWSLEAFKEGWKKAGGYTFTLFFKNSFLLVVPTVLCTIVSSTLVAFGFARFNFPFKKLLFGMMIATLMLPNAVLIIPRYLLFRNLSWLNGYKPFIVPAALATSGFFNYLLIQFFRGIPRELDESAKIDGCNSLQILLYILAPLMKPAIVSVTIFQFIWTWNDFFNSMIYINSTDKFTVSLGLRLAIDSSAATNYSEVLAMAVLAIVPCILIYIFAQEYFVEGVATTGLKG